VCELGIGWTGSKAPGHAQIGECGKPCNGPTKRPQRLADQKNTAGDGGWWVTSPRNKIRTVIEK
jgi:hypothetical protein